MLWDSLKLQATILMGPTILRRYNQFNNNNLMQVRITSPTRITTYLFGIISSEPGQPKQLKVQRTIILPHRQDGKDYTGLLTFTATKPVKVLFGHRLYIDNKTLSSLDAKRFGNLFLVTPAQHTCPNAINVLSAPTVIKPDYNGSSPPYYAASLPFVASSVVLRTVGGIPFIAVYEVNAHIGQPRETNNITTAVSSNANQ
jgi:hypothetical protein